MKSVIMAVLLGLAAQCLSFGESIFPDLQGSVLIEKLREAYVPSRVLNYRDARLQMFTVVDSDNGKVTLCYTGQKYATTGIPPGNEVNTEHTWPQSQFEIAIEHNLMKCDIHHLFPSESTVNSRRGNNAFGEIPDNQTQYWYRSKLYQTQPPAADIRDEFSEAINSLFEPREAQKGNVARALFYFYAIYGGQRVNTNWLTPQIQTLVAWDDKDAPDGAEVERSSRIKNIQGNDNPFVLDRTLARRMFGMVSAPPTPEDPTTDPNDGNEAPSVSKVRVAQWNAHEVFSVQDANAKSTHFQAFAADIKPDVVTINEFTSRDELRQIAQHMGIGNNIAWSDFVQNDNGQHDAFEVGVISRFPITEFTEYDFDLDNRPSEGDPTEAQLVIPSVPGLVTARAGRGFLRVRIEDLKLILYVTHLKSSNGATGSADKDNAKKREVVAAAMVAQAKTDSAALPGYTFVIAGDMNIGETDAAKNGNDLSQDTYSGSGDRYDDTHAIFATGLTGGLPFTSKTKTLGMETYDSPSFLGTGPIDCIYVAGPGAVQFTPATRSASTFDSDHFSVYVDWNRPSDGGNDDNSDPNLGGDGATDATIRVGAWNIENLGTRGADSSSAADQAPADLAGYMVDSGVAVLVLEEIHDNEQESSDHPGAEPWENDILDATLEILRQRTGDQWAYLLTAPAASNERQQMTGVAWNTAKAKMVARKIVNVAGGQIGGANIWARRPEAFHFSVGIGKTDFIVVPLHMKSNSDGESIGRNARAEEAKQLAAALPSVQANLGGEQDIILLGDTNMKKGETTASTHWGTLFKDLNADGRFTYIKPFGNEPFPPFDRIFVPIGQSEFTEAEQRIHGPYGNNANDQKTWRREHLRKRSDHLLIWMEVKVMQDDD